MRLSQQKEFLNQPIKFPTIKSVKNLDWRQFDPEKRKNKFQKRDFTDRYIIKLKSYGKERKTGPGNTRQQIETIKKKNEQNLQRYQLERLNSINGLIESVSRQYRAVSSRINFLVSKDKDL